MPPFEVLSPKGEKRKQLFFKERSMDASTLQNLLGAPVSSLDFGSYHLHQTLVLISLNFPRAYRVVHSNWPVHLIAIIRRSINPTETFVMVMER